MQTKRKPYSIGGLVFVAAASLFVPGCGEEPPPPEPVIRPVRTQTVFVAGSGRTRSFAGTSRASLESRLSFKVAGTVNRVAVSVGDRVNAGDVIARIEDRDYRLQVQEAEAALKSARAQARSAESNYSRVRALYENRNASANDLDAARAASESATAQVRRGEKGVELAKSQLSYTTLEAPVAGSIASVMVEENENVSPGQGIALLTSGSQLEVRVAIPQVLIAQIREEDAVVVTLDAVPGRTFDATVTEVGVSSTGTATTYPVLVRLNHADSSHRPGMAAEVSFTFGANDGRDRIMIPAVAVAEDREGRYVYVTEEAGDGFATTSRRAVEIGDLTEEGLEILEGLTDGDRVVTAGVSRIHDGQKVRVLQ